MLTGILTLRAEYCTFKNKLSWETKGTFLSFFNQRLHKVSSVTFGLKWACTIHYSSFKWTFVIIQTKGKGCFQKAMGKKYIYSAHIQKKGGGGGRGFENTVPHALSPKCKQWVQTCTASIETSLKIQMPTRKKDSNIFKNTRHHPDSSILILTKHYNSHPLRDLEILQSLHGQRNEQRMQCLSQTLFDVRVKIKSNTKCRAVPSNSLHEQRNHYRL